MVALIHPRLKKKVDNQITKYWITLFTVYSF